MRGSAAGAASKSKASVATGAVDTVYGPYSGMMKGSEEIPNIIEADSTAVRKCTRFKIAEKLTESVSSKKVGC